jgi:hypothetical protein
MRNFARLLALLGVFAALGLSEARATIVLDRPVPALAAHAQLVARARVVGQKVQWDEAHRVIVTRTFFQGLEALKGELPPRFVVRQVGGSLGDVHLRVAGRASFAVGEEVVLFLEKHPVASGEYVLESMAASKFTVVTRDGVRMAERSTEGLTLAQPGQDGVIRPDGAPPTPNTMPYETLSKLVKSAAAAAAPPVVPLPGHNTTGR